MPFLQNVTRGRGIPAGTAGGGGRALLRGRRGQPDQPAVPGPDRRDRQGLRRGRGGPADLLGQPELGSLPDRDRGRDGRRRGAAGAGLRHLGLRVLLELPAVPGRHRAGAGRGRARGTADRQDPALLPPPGFHRAVRRRHRGGHRVAASRASARTSRSCSRRTACRRSWPRPAGRRPAAATRRSWPRPPGSSPNGSAAAGPAAGTPGGWSTRAAAGRRRSPGSARTSATTWRTWPGTELLARSWSRSASSATTWRSSTTWTSRRRRPPGASGCRWPAPRPRVRTRASSR